jgi:hypothetical protein
MPRGWTALDGPHPEFAALYGMREHESEKYPDRTAANVRDSDGTLRFAADWNSAGERLTADLCRANQKPFLDVSFPTTASPSRVAAWVRANNVKVLNVAGNAEHRARGLEAFVASFLVQVFRELDPALTPRQDKVEYVTRQGQTRDHTCHWPGCGRQVPPAMWGCAGCWKKLPANIRKAIWDTYRPGQEVNMTPSREYVLAARAAQDWIKSNHPETIGAGH